MENTQPSIGHNSEASNTDRLINALETGSDVRCILDDIAVSEFDCSSDDVSTVKARKEIASQAYAISKIKSKTNAVGKRLTLVWREKTKVVTSACAEIRNHVDDLKDAIRKPLDDWERDESIRVLEIKNKIGSILEHYLGESSNSGAIKDRIAFNKSLDFSSGFDEFEEEALGVNIKTISSLEMVLESVIEREKKEKEQAELAAIAEKKGREQAEELAELRRYKEQQEAERAERVRVEQEAEIARKAVEDAASKRLAKQIGTFFNPNAITEPSAEGGPSKGPFSDLKRENEISRKVLDNEKSAKDVIESIENSFLDILGGMVTESLVSTLVKNIVDGNVKHLEVIYDVK